MLLAHSGRGMPLHHTPCSQQVTGEFVPHSHLLLSGEENFWRPHSSHSSPSQLARPCVSLARAGHTALPRTRGRKCPAPWTQEALSWEMGDSTAQAALLCRAHATVPGALRPPQSPCGKQLQVVPAQAAGTVLHVDSWCPLLLPGTEVTSVGVFPPPLCHFLLDMGEGGCVNPLLGRKPHSRYLVMADSRGDPRNCNGMGASCFSSG
jgi:hypothetical protein